MMLVIGLGLSLIAGMAQAASMVDIPVEVSTVEVNRNQPPRWEEARQVPDSKAASIISAGEKAGGMCHHLPAEKMVVCVYSGSRSVGLDWRSLQTMSEAMGATYRGAQEHQLHGK